MAVDYATLKKGGFMRQKQKNHFSLRLRVVGGNLTAKQLAKIAEVAEQFGDGHVHLTSRQSVEIPFVKLDQIEEVKAALAEGDVEPGVRTACPYHYRMSGRGNLSQRLYRYVHTGKGTGRTVLCTGTAP